MLIYLKVWESCGSGSISFDCKDVGTPEIAHIIENNVIIEGCSEKVKECQQIEMKYGSKLTNIDNTKSKVIFPYILYMLILTT